ncbi:hypothetical protein PIB30_073351 [Stylosanthes scabra]|uniref:Uncharacterized protein n=1 Tax=Stylosanthes scabra TaxID=79078 RepID=A0ABU6ZN18_9FABA|nr:hypothetical protein [Stylosanthes scabra]
MILAEIACLRGVLQFLEGLAGIDCWNSAEILDKAAGSAGITAALVPLHCLLQLEASAHLHHHHLAAVGVHSLIVLGKLKFSFPYSPCAITAMLSAIMSSALTSSP